MALLAKFAVGNQLSWSIEVTIWSFMECGFLSTPQLCPRLWQAHLMDQVPLVPPCQHGSTLSLCRTPRSGDCFPMNYLHKFSAAAGDKTSGTEQQHAPDLSHRWTNGGSSTRRAHKGAAPAGALTPLCHSYLLLCHNGPAAPAGPPGPSKRARDNNEPDYHCSLQRTESTPWEERGKKKKKAAGKKKKKNPSWIIKK